MDYNLNINDKYFQLIKSGEKTVEGRAQKSIEDNKYEQMVPKDTITFVTDKEKLNCEIRYVKKYQTIE